MSNTKYTATGCIAYSDNTWESHEIEVVYARKIDAFDAMDLWYLDKILLLALGKVVSRSDTTVYHMWIQWWEVVNE
jgi:hypothetical protein